MARQMRSLFCVAFIFPSLLLAQTRGDSLLATERSIDRPITLHKGQIRATGAYSLSVISWRFDNLGNANSLRDEGLSSFRHRFGLDIKYGLLEFIQLSAFTYHSSRTVRDQTRSIFPINPQAEPSVSLNRLDFYRGIEDITAAVDFRAPFKTRKIDVAMTIGISLPVAEHNPDKPSHTISYSEDGQSSRYDIVYRYNYNLGNGVSLLHLGGMVKYRLADWAFSARLDYRHGLKDGSSYQWTHQLVDYETFEYRQEPFIYRLPDTFEYYAEIEYQSLPWFDLILNVSGYNGQNGWKTDGPYRVGIPDATLIMVNPGVELIVTPRLWFRQELQFPVYGKNYEGATTFHTSLIYNFFLY
jgi:hypothetical protein